MKRILQMIPTHHRHDAAGAEVLVIQRRLRERGWQVDNFADHLDPELEGLTAPSSALDGIDTDDALAVYHFCVASPMTYRFIELDCPKVIIFHNVTPGDFFRPYDEGIAWACDEGRRELKLLADHTDLAIAHSEYSRTELAENGFDVTRTIPYLFDAGRYAEPADAAYGKVLGADPLVLFVGRMAPNKAPDDFLRVAAAYHRGGYPRARFVIAGKRHVLPGYTRELDALYAELGLRPEQLLLTDEISQAQLHACYRQASLFLSSSRHEGFMVPLLECFLFGLPVMARAAAAVPETLGEAGFLYDTDDPERIAANVARLLGDEKMRSILRQRGFERLKRYDLERWLFVLHVLLGQL
jgi:glycosyltransferase involved in cell wall biosynthesis